MCVCVAFPQSKKWGEATSCVTPRHAKSHRATPRRAMPRHAAVLRCCALALLCAALAHAELEKRAEISPVPFVMGSRYGRSPERVMTPRNDRFFMGSRYGKRSELRGEEAALCAPGAPSVPCARRLLCEHGGAGVLAFLKCVRAHKHLQYSRRTADDPGPDEE